MCRKTAKRDGQERLNKRRKRTNRWSRPAHPVRGEIRTENNKKKRHGKRKQSVVKYGRPGVHGRKQKVVVRLTRRTPVKVMIASRKNRRSNVRKVCCEGARREILLHCATADRVLMRRRRAVADPDELRVVGTAVARRIREKQHDTDPNRRYRRRRRRLALACSLPGVKVCCGRPPSRAVTSVRRRAHLLTHTQNNITNICMCVCVCVCV